MCRADFHFWLESAFGEGPEDSAAEEVFVEELIAAAQGGDQAHQGSAAEECVADDQDTNVVDGFEDDEAAYEADGVYTRLLAEAEACEFGHIKKWGFLHLVQDDALHQPVVVLLLRNVQAAAVEPERLLLFVIWMLDTIVNSQYSVVLLCAGAGMANVPPLGWLRSTPELLSDKYSDSLNVMYVVEASITLRTLLGCMSPLVSDALWDRIRFIDDCNQLFHRDSKVGHCCQLLLGQQ